MEHVLQGIVDWINHSSTDCYKASRHYLPPRRNPRYKPFLPYQPDSYLSSYQLCGDMVVTRCDGPPSRHQANTLSPPSHHYSAALSPQWQHQPATVSPCSSHKEHDISPQSFHHMQIDSYLQRYISICITGQARSSATLKHYPLTSPAPLAHRGSCQDAPALAQPRQAAAGMPQPQPVLL